MCNLRLRKKRKMETIYARSIIFVTITLIITLKCHSEIRRQFDHYKEFLANKNKEMALREKQSDYNWSSYYDTRSQFPAGPKRNKLYNPTFGYEPYWKGGEWVFNRTRTNATICGYQCFKLYIWYGPVCAVSRKNKYKSFDNICAVRAFDCYDRQMWRIIHRGACRDLKSYQYARNDLANMTEMAITRAYTYMNDFKAAYGKNIDRRNMDDDLEANRTNLHRLLR